MSDVAEKAVIGSLLIDISCIQKIYNDLKADMFNDPLLKEAYRELVKGYDIGDVPNIVTLSQKLENDMFVSEFIASSLLSCVNSIVTSVEVKKYSDVVIRDYKARTFNQMLSRMKTTPANIDKQIGEFINELEALKGQERTVAKKLSQIVSENRVKRFVEKTEIPIYTGLPKLDDCLGGLEGGDVIVIGARPAVGKSALVTQITLSVARDNKRVCFYNLEMEDSQVYDRYISHESKIQLTRVRRAEAFLGDEEKKFNAANDSLSELDVFISSGSKSISEIRNEVRHLEPDLLIIDYLQLVKSDFRRQNRIAEVGDISKAIKALAMELHVPILLLSQLNRMSTQTMTKEPSMSELRESGDIEQDASIIILMWEPDASNSAKKALKVEKNRQGTTMRESLEFNGGLMEFVESDEPIKPKRDGFRSAVDEDIPFN